jgi:hypothetical protein
MNHVSILVSSIEKSIEATRRALRGLDEEETCIYQGSGGYYRAQREEELRIWQDVTVQFESFYYGSYGSDPTLPSRVKAEVARRVALSAKDGEIARLRALDKAERKANAVEYRRIDGARARLTASLARLEASLAEARKRLDDEADRAAYAAKRADVLRSLGIAALAAT